MKHQVKGRIFGREIKQRTALLRTLCGSLIMHEKIITTEAKAKEVRPLVERCITKAKKARERSRDAFVSVRLLQQHMPLVAAKKLSGSFLDRFAARTSGYTRIVKLPHRKSDSARMALVMFVDQHGEIAKEAKAETNHAQTS